VLAPARGAAQNQAMPEPIELRVDLEEADVRRGLFFTLVRHSPGLRFLPAFYALAAVGLSAGLYFVGRGRVPSGTELFFGAVCLVVLVGIPLAVRRLARRAFEAVPERAATYRFRDEHVQIQSGEAVTTLPWAKLYQAHETRRAFYLHPKPGAFHVIPKRGLGETEREAVAAWLGAKAKKRRATEIVSWMSPSIALVLMLATYAVYLWLS